MEVNLHQAVKSIVEAKVQQRLCFSAYDITSALRDLIKSGKAKLSGHKKVIHREVRTIVKTLIPSDYGSEVTKTVPSYLVYGPKVNTPQPNPSADPVAATLIDL